MLIISLGGISVMEIQNISGPDAVPRGYPVSSEISSESVKNTEEAQKQETVLKDESKGNNVDSYA